MDNREERYLERFYEYLVKGDTRAILTLNIPKSDIFYIRRNIYEKLGIWLSLEDTISYLESEKKLI